MRIKQYSQSIVPKWLKWTFLVLCLGLISCFIYAGFLYHDIQSSKKNGFSETKEFVLNETDLISIDRISRFQEKIEYHILAGSTKEKEAKMVFVPMNKSENYTVINTSEVISKQRIKEQWQTKCSNCKLIEITPAMINDKPLWEITYVDSSDRYIFDYLSIYDGTRYEQYRLKSMFN